MAALRAWARRHPALWSGFWIAWFVYFSIIDVHLIALRMGQMTHGGAGPILAATWDVFQLTINVAILRSVVREYRKWRRSDDV